MRAIISKLVHFGSWIAAVATVLATAYGVAIVADGNYCWTALEFAFGIATPLALGALLLGIIPSAILYLQKKQRRDLISLLLAGYSLVIMLVEAILLNFIIPQRGE
jgi:hypothetical protein